MAVVLTLPFGEPAYSALVALVGAAKVDDALAPVTVVVPSNYAGLAVRRRIATSGGVANVRFLVMSRLTELVGAPRLSASRRPLNAWTRAEAIRAALIGHRGVFVDVAAHPATERALEHTFRDLRLAPEGALEQMAEVSRRGADVVALYRRFRRLTEGFYDPQDLAAAAADEVAAGSAAMADIGRVILYLPRALSPAEEGLMRSLLVRDGADVIFGTTHDALADAPTIEFAARLGAAIPAPGLEGQPVLHASRVLRAVDAEEEVRSVIRLIFAAVESGTKLYRIGVLFSSGDDYASLAQEQFTASGIPFNGPPTRPLARCMAARVLLGMLKLPDTQFRRSTVMEWLTSGPIIGSRSGDRAGKWAEARRWDELSRDAGVVKGAGQWQVRIHAWLSDKRRHESDIESGNRLLEFMEELQQRLVPPRERSMSALARWALSLLDRYLGSESMAASWKQPAEADAYAELRKRLDAIAKESPVRDPDSGEALVPLSRLPDGEVLSTFVQAVESSLETSSGRLGRFGDGVFLGPISAARGMHFDLLFILGAVEGVLPTTVHEDPLLPDFEREAAQIPARQNTSRADYLAALAASNESTLCFSQSSLRAQAKQIPSRWLLESAKALASEPELSSEALLTMGQRPWLVTVASFEAAIATEALAPASAQEWELRSLSRCEDPNRHFLNSDQSFGASLQAMQVRLPRWSRRWELDHSVLSPWVGGIGPGGELESERSYSPTSFQTLATCPFQYFLKQVSRVKETQRPEAIVRISGADRGNLIHEVLNRFLTGVAAEDRSPRPGEAWSEADRTRLIAIAAEECAKVYERGITGSELLWRIDRARIYRDVVLFLDADTRARSETGATFFQAERAFGSFPTDGESDAQPGDAAWPDVEVPINGGQFVKFRGRIDRVDVVRAVEPREFIVYDYKTGSARAFGMIESGEDRLDRGQQLQLPIYALAVRQALGDASTRVSSNYWFVSEREEFRPIGYEVTPADEENLSATLGVLVGTIQAGTFPPVPGVTGFDARRQRNTFKNCTYCAFDRLCAGGDRAEAWSEWSSTEELQGYIALVDPAKPQSQGAQPGGVD